MKGMVCRKDRDYMLIFYDRDSRYIHEDRKGVSGDEFETILRGTAKGNGFS